MFVFLYLICSAFLTHLLTYKINNHYAYLFLMFMVLFTTPAQIGANDPNTAPAIFTFFFNIILESDYSFRPLRPLVLSLPISLMLLFFLRKVRKGFFQ